MIRAVVVEDEPLARRFLKGLLEATGRVRVVEEAGDGATGLECCRRSAPDVAFLDIELPGPDGLSLAEGLLALPSPPLVVFVTGYAGHAVDAFRVEAVDFVVKPVDPDLLYETIGRLERRLAARSPGETPERIQIRDADGGVLRLVPRGGVVAVVRRSRRTWVHTANSAFASHEPLASVGRRLGGPPFLQISRDAIVNLDEIQAVRRLGDRHYQVELRDRDRTRVEASRTGSALLAERLKTP